MAFRAPVGVALATGLAAAALFAPAASADAGAPARGGQPDQTFTPVVAEVVAKPRWTRTTDGRVLLEHDLRLTNGFPVGATVRKIEVLDQRDRVVKTLEGDELAAAISPVGSPAQSGAEIPPSSAAFAFIDTDLSSPKRLPTSVSHRITVDIEPGLPVPESSTWVSAETPVSQRPPVEIASPLRGDQWFGVLGAHRRAIQPVNGTFTNGQRWALDWNRLDANDAAVSGDPGLNASYPQYGAPLRAVADGKVVRAVDGIPDQDPANFQPLGADQGDGNYVVLKLAKRTYAAYAHIVPGTVAVERGERVKMGEVVGELGNSGNSDGAHLHFQLMTTPSLLASDGLPFVIDGFDVTGQIASVDSVVNSLQTGEPVQIDSSPDQGAQQSRTPLSLQVTDFG